MIFSKKNKECSISSHLRQGLYIPGAGASVRNQTLKRPPLFLVLGISTQRDEISVRFETLRLGCLKLYDQDCNNGRLATLPGRKTPFPCVQNRPFSYVVHIMQLQCVVQGLLLKVPSGARSAKVTGRRWIGADGRSSSLGFLSVPPGHCSGGPLT